MNTRLARSAASAVLLLLCLPLPSPAATTLYVATTGDDSAAGSEAAPLRTQGRARDVARALKHPPGGVRILVRGGTYYLDEPLVFTPDDSGAADAPVRFEAAAGDAVVFSGARKLDVQWTPYQGGILKAQVPGVKEGKLSFDQLFLDGRLQHLARYPNYDPGAAHYGGTAADALSPERVRKWAHPETAILHALHGNAWGDLHYRVTGVDARGDAILEGGWQNNRPSSPHKSIRFVENVFEELDAPGEWFLDTSAGALYLYPPAGVDPARARVEVSVLKHLVEFRGTKENPVKFVTLAGIGLRHAGRTFLEKYEPLLRTDWAIYRGGAVLLAGAEDCGLADCDLEDLGGNAVFVSGYNRRVSVTGCRFNEVGASGVCFVGDVSAVRVPTDWKHPADWATMDRAPGPKTDDYPADCRVEDCLIHHFGTIEKQVAGVEIDMASRITVRHCSIYDCPRAGINIGDGCWGGHLIEFCDVFDTVKETGDHGSFNSWGRDRFWGLAGKPLEQAVEELPDLPKLDVVEPITLRNNRWRCDHGWDIDLDDGSSNYHITSNLCLHGGIKNREGYYRVVENNVMVDNTFHPHVWYPASHEVFRHNIVAAPYRPAVMKHWDGELDYNLFPNEQALREVREKYHTDAHSLAGDPQFVDPREGNYAVRDTSPALTVGFVNFVTGEFGVISPRLKAEARTPGLVGDAASGARDNTADARPRAWLGGKARNVAGLGDRSAFGLPDETGVVVEEAPDGSGLAKLGLKPNDVITGLGKDRVKTVDELLSHLKKLPAGTQATLAVVRGQQEREVRFVVPE